MFEFEVIQDLKLNNEIILIKLKVVKALTIRNECLNVNKAVKRNIDRFPEGFCFQLTEMEFKDLRFQIGTLNKKVNNGEVTRKYLPYVFNE